MIQIGEQRVFTLLEVLPTGDLLIGHKDPWDDVDIRLNVSPDAWAQAPRFEPGVKPATGDERQLKVRARPKYATNSMIGRDVAEVTVATSTDGQVLVVLGMEYDGWVEVRTPAGYWLRIVDSSVRDVLDAFGVVAE